MSMEPTASGGPPPAGPLLRVSPVWWLNLAIAMAALALYVAVVHDLPALLDPHLPWWGLAAGFLVAESCVVHLQFRRNAHSFSLGDLPLVFGLLFATGGNLVLGALVGSAATLVIERRLAPVKLVFNLSQFAFAASLATLVVHALAPTAAAVDPDTWGAVLVGTMASAVITVMLIGMAISLSEGTLRLNTIGQMFAMDFVVTATNTSLGLAGAI